MDSTGHNDNYQQDEVIAETEGKASTTSISEGDIRNENRLLKPIAKDMEVCWICYLETFVPSSEDTDDFINPSTIKLIHACECKNSMAWVHECCLLKWIAQQQLGLPGTQITCPACLYPYKITENIGVFSMISDGVDFIVSNTYLGVLATGVGLGTYVINTTYGAFAIMTMCGSRLGTQILGGNWSWRTWVGLPMIPFALISSRFNATIPFLPILPFLVVKGEDIRLDRWPLNPATIVTLLPWAKFAYDGVFKVCRSLLNPWLGVEPKQKNENPAFDDAPMAALAPQPQIDIYIDMENVLQKVLGALMIPAISALVGSSLTISPWITRNFADTFSRNVLGGCITIVIKDIYNLVSSYQKRKIKCSRRIQQVPLEDSS